jgi:cyclic pyranopterin phosphate synthase
MKDSFGRDITYLRVSVTKRCNLNCVYCGKTDCAKKENELTADEIAEIASAFVACGVSKIRLTGGEPLVRSDICDVAARLHALPGLRTLALTTNGVYLGQYAARLKEAGVGSVNISLDSTDGGVYRKLTGADVLHRVLEGIDEARRAGLTPIKINAVLMRGVNEDSAEALIDLARTQDVDVRFIELMPFSDAGEDASRVVTNDALLEKYSFLQPLHLRDGTAELYTAEDFRGRVGFISPISHRFCASCNRMRLLSDGKVKLCLGDDTTVDLRPLVGRRAALIEAVQSCIRNKPAGHRFGEQTIPHGLNRTGG